MRDVALAWCWLPIAFLVHSAVSDDTSLRVVMGAVFLLSFAHQPITLALVYGDEAQRTSHTQLYRWAPVVLFGLVGLGLTFGASIVAVLAVVLNAHHTLMQRYGVMRIYGRKRGDDHGRIEKAMLVSWMLTGVAFIGAFTDLDALVSDLGVGRTNGAGIELLGTVAGPSLLIFWTATLAAIGSTVVWARRERSVAGGCSRGKHLYAASTLALVVVVMFDPVAGVAGFIGAHAIEYFAVVDSSLRTRRDDARVARATATTSRRVAAYLLYAAAIFVTVRLARGQFDGRLYTFLLVYAGALHILYDGFIWKLRRAPVAASLGIAQAAPSMASGVA